MFEVSLLYEKYFYINIVVIYGYFFWITKHKNVHYANLKFANVYTYDFDKNPLFMREQNIIKAECIYVFRNTSMNT